MTLYLDKSNWKHVAFGDVVTNLNVTVKDPVAAGIDRVIAMEHLDPGELKIRRWGSIEGGTTFTRRVRPGQTLFGKRRAYQRKVAYSEFDAICSGDILTFEPDNAQMLAEFLPFLVQSKEFFDHALDTSAGSLSPRTNWRDLSSFDFYLPPLGEQKRIADLLWVIERHHRSVATAASRARDVDARALEVVSQTDWPLKTVAALGDVQLGQQLHPKYRSGPKMRKYLRVANVFDDQLDLSDVASMDFSDAGVEKFRLRRGDILLNEGQSIELVGRCAMFRDEIEDCYMQKTLLRFRSGPEILPDFALAWFRRCYLVGDFSALAKRTTSMAHLTAVRFSAMPMPCPPLDVQRDLVARSATVKAAAEALRAELTRLDSLRFSLMAATFGGN
jgi:type I restriction enzyme S subunit